MIDKNSNSIVLNMFFDNPTKEFHARELSRKTNLSIFAVLEAIKKLSKEELISVHKKGNMKIVKALHSIKFLRAKRIRNLEKIYISGLVDQLNEAYDKPEAIILFGSYSRGDDVETSDVDIAIITKDHKNQALEKFEKLLSRKISLHEIDLKKVSKEFHNNLINGIILEGAIS
ncbi:MAG TPA: nucleotidyltransferase domain-containing protein [archaeon]|nr:nucleotidyltransferase domain-containing protein [archaeon]